MKCNENNAFPVTFIHLLHFKKNIQQWSKFGWVVCKVLFFPSQAQLRSVSQHTGTMCGTIASSSLTTEVILGTEAKARTGTLRIYDAA
jgi:hypothetical protein